MVEASRDDYRKGRRFILCDLINDAGLLSTPLVVLDVGARDALASTPWAALPPEMVRLYGFEPDTQQCQSLNEAAKAAGLDFHFHPIALAGRTGQVDFYRYAEEAANSFYPPNPRFVERLSYGRDLPLSAQFKLVDKRTIEAKSLADWAPEAGVSHIDFCKLNVQGAELEVMRGAGPLLDCVNGLVAEQTFNPTYLGAPLFGETYEFIRAAGFTLFDIVGMNRVARTCSPVHITDDCIFSVKGNWPRHQLLEGHFLYFRDPILTADNSSFGSISPEQCIKLCCMAELFGQVEFAFELLSLMADSRRTAQMGTRCREIVTRAAELYLEISQVDALLPENLSPGAFWEQQNGLLAAENQRLLNELNRLSQGDLAARASRVPHLEAELGTMEGEITRLLQERRQLYASLSWRLTSPLRTVKRLLVGVLKK